MKDHQQKQYLHREAELWLEMYSTVHSSLLPHSISQNHIAFVLLLPNQFCFIILQIKLIQQIDKSNQQQFVKVKHYILHEEKYFFKPQSSLHHTLLKYHWENVLLLCSAQLNWRTVVDVWSGDMCCLVSEILISKIYQNNNLIIVTNMVQSKGKGNTQRARIAHKLAKYYRATHIHLSGLKGDSSPSLAHLKLGGAPKRRLRNKDNTWYPADDEKKRFVRANTKPQPSAGRKSIQAGSIVILLSGPHRGRRVVVLNKLASGNLLITGPYAINGVPLGRVNPAYVLSTSSKVSLDGVNVNVNDSFFKKSTRFTKNELKNASEHRLKQVEEGKAAEGKFKEELKAAQKAVDGKLLDNIKKVEHLKGYLGTRFTLSNGSRPHELKF